MVAEILVTSAGVNLNSIDRWCRDPLSLAAEKVRERVVSLLLAKHKVNTNTYDKSLRTPLFYAAQQGQTVVVQLLLDYGASIEATDNIDQTALLTAAVEGQETTVQQLFSHGANIEAINSSGNTALSWGSSERAKDNSAAATQPWCQYRGAGQTRRDAVNVCEWRRRRASCPAIACA